MFNLGKKKTGVRDAPPGTTFTSDAPPGVLTLGAFDDSCAGSSHSLSRSEKETFLACHLHCIQNQDRILCPT